MARLLSTVGPPYRPTAFASPRTVRLQFQLLAEARLATASPPSVRLPQTAHPTSKMLRTRKTATTTRRLIRVVSGPMKRRMAAYTFLRDPPAVRRRRTVSLARHPPRCVFLPLLWARSSFRTSLTLPLPASQFAISKTQQLRVYIYVNHLINASARKKIIAFVFHTLLCSYRKPW